MFRATVRQGFLAAAASAALFFGVSITASGQSVTPAPGQGAGGGPGAAPSQTVQPPVQNTQDRAPRTPTPRAPDQVQRAPTPPEATAPELVFPPVENTVPGSEGNIVLPPAENLGGGRGQPVLPSPETTVPEGAELTNELPGPFDNNVLDTPSGVLEPQPQQPLQRTPETVFPQRFQQGGFPAPQGTLETVVPGSRPGAASAITAPIEPYDADEPDALDYSVSP